MPKGLSVNIDVTKMDVFNKFINILKEVVEDKRIPNEVKCEIMDKINNLINKKEDKSNAKVK